MDAKEFKKISDELKRLKPMPTIVGPDGKHYYPLRVDPTLRTRELARQFGIELVKVKTTPPNDPS